jgi:phosphocarrier protein
MSDRIARQLTIVNRRGLHARASAKFVKCAEAFNAEVAGHARRSDGGGHVIMGLMMLAARSRVPDRLGAGGRNGGMRRCSADLVADGFGERIGRVRLDPT